MEKVNNRSVVLFVIDFFLQLDPFYTASCHVDDQAYIYSWNVVNAIETFLQILIEILKHSLQNFRRVLFKCFSCNICYSVKKSIKYIQRCYYEIRLTLWRRMLFVTVVIQE